jgi:hypothetical protein
VNAAAAKLIVDPIKKLLSHRSNQQQSISSFCHFITTEAISRNESAIYIQRKPRPNFS